MPSKSSDEREIARSIKYMAGYLLIYKQGSLLIKNPILINDGKAALSLKDRNRFYGDQAVRDVCINHNFTKNHGAEVHTKSPKRVWL